MKVGCKDLLKYCCKELAENDDYGIMVFEEAAFIIGRSYKCDEYMVKYCPFCGEKFTGGNYDT